VFLCISSYSKTRSRRIIYALFSQPVPHRPPPRWGTFVPRPLICPPLEKILRAPISVCALSVCNTYDNFRKRWRGKFTVGRCVGTTWGDTGKVRIWRSSGQGQCHGSKKAQNSLFPQCKTLIGNKCGFIRDKAVKFACSMGFLAMADQTMWTPSLSRDRKWPRLSKCTHSRMVCHSYLRRENIRVTLFQSSPDLFKLSVDCDTQLFCSVILSHFVIDKYSRSFLITLLHFNHIRL